MRVGFLFLGEHELYISPTLETDFTTFFFIAIRSQEKNQGNFILTPRIGKRCGPIWKKASFFNTYFFLRPNSKGRKTSNCILLFNMLGEPKVLHVITGKTKTFPFILRFWFLTVLSKFIGLQILGNERSNFLNKVF